MTQNTMTLPYAVPERLEWQRTSVRIFLVLIVLAFVFPRLALLLTASGLPVSDAKWYFDRAVSIVHGNGYAFDGIPTAFWPVGYPGFLALLFWSLPETPETGLIANFFLAAITVTCSFRIYRELPISNAFALFRILVLTAFPNFIFYQNLLLSEMLMTAILSISLLALIVARRNYQVLATGVFFGLATLVKSQALFLPLLPFIYDVWGHPAPKAVVHRYALLAAGMLLIIFPWSMRNYFVFDRFILVQSNGGYNLLMGNNEHNRWGGSTGAAAEFAAMFPGIVEDINRPLSDELGMNDRAAAMAVRFIVSNPVEALKRVPYKVYRFFSHDPQGIRSLMRSNAAAGNNAVWLLSLFTLSFWYYTVVMMLAVLSWIVFFLLPLRSRAHFILLCTILYFAAILAAFYGEGRFHIPVLPAFVGCMLVTLQGMRLTLWPPRSPRTSI